MTRAQFRLGLAATLCVALAAQAGLFFAGFYAVAADESARALFARDLSLATFFDPDIWPPLYKWAVGAALQLHGDMFLTPRLVSNILGLLTILAVAWCARELFQARAPALLAGVLSLFVSHRLIFAAAPMSEMLFNPLMVCAFAAFARHARRRSDRTALLVAVFLALAAMTRYEAWFVSAAFGAWLAWRCFVDRKLSFPTLAAAALVVSAFPAAWLFNAAMHEGGIGALFITKIQAEASGASLVQSIFWGHAMRYAQDVLLSPLILALAPAALLAAKDGAIRAYCAAIIATLALVSIISVATGSVAFAANWRLSGAWTLASLPFLARAILDFSRAAPARWRSAAVLAGAAVASAGFLLSTGNLLADLLRTPVFTQGDLAAGRFAGDYARRADRTALIEAEDLSYLNVIVASNAPNLMITTAGDKPNATALYIEAADYWREKDPDLYARHVAPKFALPEGGDAAALDARSVGLVLVKSPESVAALERSGRFRRIGAFDAWIAFERL